MKVQVTLSDGVKIVVDYIKSADNGFNAVELYKLISKGVDYDDWRTMEFRYGAIMGIEENILTGDEWIKMHVNVRNIKQVEFIAE